MFAWGGISSLQFGLSLFWTEGKRRGFTLQDVNKYLSRGPAKLAGLQDRKGKIEVSNDIMINGCYVKQPCECLFPHTWSQLDQFYTPQSLCPKILPNLQSADRTYFQELCHRSDFLT
jgi:hypothetical protein